MSYIFKNNIKAKNEFFRLQKNKFVIDGRMFKPYQNPYLASRGYILYIDSKLSEKKYPNEYYLYGYYYVMNPILKKYIRMNKESYNTYMKYKGTEYSPYQSLDMKKYGNIRLAKKEHIEEYMHSKNEVIELLKDYPHFSPKDYKELQCVVSKPSDIDILKMYPNYTYIFQIDTNTINHLEQIESIISNICGDEDIIGIFVPYIPYNNAIMNIDKHPLYNDEYIANNDIFMKYLHNSEINIGSTIYSFARFLEKMDNIKNISSLNILQREKDITYGFNKYQVAEILITRNNALKILRENTKHYRNIYNELLEKILKEKIGVIGKYDYLVSEYKKKLTIGGCNEQSSLCELIRTYTKEKYDNSHTYYINNLDDKMIYNVCLYDELNLEILINDNLEDYDIINDNNVDIINDICIKNFKFSQQDSFMYARKECTKYMYTIKTLYPDIYDTLASYLHIKLDQQINRDLLLEYMPEWYKYIRDGYVDKAFEFRQVILGNLNIVKDIGKCSIIFRSDPFINVACDINGISWDININKVLLVCSLNSDIIFPIRLVIDDKINIYDKINNLSDMIYIGSYLRKMKDRIYPYNMRIYQTFVYYDKKRKKNRYINHRNKMVFSNFFENRKILYNEINSIMYFREDYGIQLYVYRYKNTKNYYISKYNKNDLYEKYISFGFSSDNTQEILGKLEEYYFYKDTEKNIKISKK